MSLYWYPIIQYDWYTSEGITVKLYSSYIDNQLSLTPLIIPPSKKNGILDIRDAMKLFAQVVDAYNKSDEIKNTKKKILFSPQYPDRLFDSDIQAEPTDTNRIVVWQLARREPGSLASQPFGSPKELKPRFRDEWLVADADDNWHHIEVRGQWWDNTIRFECWAPTSDEADELAEFFESFITETSNYMMRSGVQKIILFGRGTDGQFSGRTKWFYRTINVFYRTEKITLSSTEAIKRIEDQAIIFERNVSLKPL